MFSNAIKPLKTALILLIALTILTGIIYPLTVTALAQLLFYWQANGSIIERHGERVGSHLIGQSFTSPQYFWGRPSATTPFPYNGAASAASNSGPSNLNFLATVNDRVLNLKKVDSPNNPLMLVPVDLVTASASGLDPEISPLAALFQVYRVAAARNLPENTVAALVQNQIQTRSFGLLGEPRVNVLALNLALDNLGIIKKQ